MKRALICGSMIVCLVCFGQLSWWKAQPAFPEPAKKPHYLLVLRYWGSAYRQGGNGDSCTIEQNWIRLVEVYDTLDEVRKRLAGNCGWDEHSVIGLWDLTKASELRVTTWTETKTIPRHVEEQKFQERQWKIEEPSR